MINGLPYVRKPPIISPPNPSFMLIPARGPLKNTFDRIRDSADFAWLVQKGIPRSWIIVIPKYPQYIG